MISCSWLHYFEISLYTNSFNCNHKVKNFGRYCHNPMLKTFMILSERAPYLYNELMLTIVGYFLYWRHDYSFPLGSNAYKAAPIGSSKGWFLLLATRSFFLVHNDIMINCLSFYISYLAINMFLWKLNNPIMY